MQREGGCTVVRQGHLIAVVRSSLIGCAVLLLVVGCAVTRSEAPQEKGKGHTEATNKEQGRSPQATASEEARCEGRQPFERPYEPNEEGWLTNDVPGCPKGGLLSGTDSNDMLDGLAGDDEVRGLGAKDDLLGGKGSDVIYGGPGDDLTLNGRDGDDVIHGGPGDDSEVFGDGGDDGIYGGDGDDELQGVWGKDVIYGGDGNDLLDGASNEDGERDELYCGKGKDHYIADKNDYVDSSCEVKRPPLPTA
jgi:hemolysin type calcium-binding protein